MSSMPLSSVKESSRKGTERMRSEMPWTREKEKYQHEINQNKVLHNLILILDQNTGTITNQ